MQRDGEEGETQLEGMRGEERKSGKWGPDVLYEVPPASGGIKPNSKGEFCGTANVALVGNTEKRKLQLSF